ncbi:PP0621 family protein [Massilia sp. TS11]|uniref:PP0621 family protein n=1 Tax=Massilia sp. TS11 TaxID=2908003 RepID=UPI001EDB3EA9|nr:PP0621 family protein [Massilia sp. TS11]MCG2583416.1 hypothetical protein [Massilia sp. TS11]
MSRLIFWIVLVLVVLYAIRVKLKGEQRAVPPAQPDPGRASGFATRGAIEDMACCAHCGVYFPVSEQVEADGRVYCSAAHARQHA